MLQDRIGIWQWGNILPSVQNAPEELLEKCEFFHDIEPAFLSVYEAMWMEVKNTK